MFAELTDPTPNNEAKVFNPEVKKRKRDGYEEGNYTQFKEAPASEFIQTTDPNRYVRILESTEFCPEGRMGTLRFLRLINLKKQHLK